MKELPSLIVGLGNPGAEHNRDRHNVGFWLADELADGVGFNAESKLLSDACQVAFNHHKVRILKPATIRTAPAASMTKVLLCEPYSSAF